MSDNTDCDDTNGSLNIDCNTTSILDREVSFNVYPNPTSGLVTISTDVQKIVVIEVYNCVGIKVGSYTNSHTLDISLLENAVYYLRITDERGNSVVNRVVKSE